MTSDRLKRWVLRAPTALFRLHAGWLLGHRFMLLRHRGRRTGRLHETVLEVVSWRSSPPEAVAMSGFGRRSNWYQNVLAGNAVEVEIARLRFAPAVRVLDVDEAAQALAGYERRNRIVAPLLRVVLSRLAGFRYDGSPASRRRLVEALPLIAFRPRS